jgi:hypothetical protein
MQTAGTLNGQNAQSIADQIRDAAHSFAGQLSDDLRILALRLR